MEIKSNARLFYVLAVNLVSFINVSETHPADGNITDFAVTDSSPMKFILSTLQRSVADLTTPHDKGAEHALENPEIKTSSNFGVIQRTLNEVNDTVRRESNEDPNNTGKAGSNILIDEPHSPLADIDDSSTLKQFLSQEKTTESNTVIQTVKRKVNKNIVIVSKSNKTLPEVTSLQDLLDVYNPSRLAVIWNRTEDLHITTKCNSDMLQYFEGLRRGHIWALQMSDASGRYSGNFLWGNTYWVGSATLCDQIKEMVFRPSFELGFYTMRVNVYINDTITPYTRSQLLGVCLPLSCTSGDVHNIVDLSARVAPTDSLRKVSIITVKTPHNRYDLFTDSVFHILVLISLAVGIMLIVGTILDYYREYKLAKRSNYTYDNYTFVFSKSSQHRPISRAPKHDAKLEMNIDNNNRTIGENTSDGSEITTENNSVASEDNVQKTSLFEEIMLSFSVRRNMLTICDQSVGADTIPTIHGLRSLSMAWVILGHTCIVAFKYSDNMSYRHVVEKEFLFQTINNGAFSVDTFFFISGLLVSFLYFRTTAKHDISKITKTKGLVTSLLQFLGMVGYRFFRLTTPYLFVLGVVQVTMKWFYYNSVFEPPTNDHINCPKYWWRNVFYINTLFPVKDMCMLWSWYLADDTQFYILGAVLLIMAVKYFWTATSLMTVFLVSSWVTTMYIAYTNQHMPNIDDPMALFDKIYDKPWTRLGPYLVGMSVGWILFKTDCKIKMNKFAVTLGWSCSAAGLFGLVYGLYERELHPLTAAAYSSLSHSIWAIALAWIVIACSTGYGGFMNKLLSATILYPFSRVTYCAYLVHPIVIRILAMRMDSPVHLGKEIVLMMYFGQLAVSYILAFVVSLAFEAPMVQLLKLVSPTKQKNK